MIDMSQTDDILDGLREPTWQVPESTVVSTLLAENAKLREALLAHWYFFATGSDRHFCIHCEKAHYSVDEIKHADGCIIKILKETA